MDHSRIFFCQFPLPKDSEDLEQDLKDVVKKVHLRVIMKEHAKLKTLKPNEGAARVSPPFAPQKSAVLQLIPFADEVVDFQHLGPSIHENLPFLFLVVLAFASPHLAADFFHFTAIYSKPVGSKITFQKCSSPGLSCCCENGHVPYSLSPQLRIENGFRLENVKV